MCVTRYRSIQAFYVRGISREEANTRLLFEDKPKGLRVMFEPEASEPLKTLDLNAVLHSAFFEPLCDALGLEKARARIDFLLAERENRLRCPAIPARPILLVEAAGEVSAILYHDETDYGDFIVAKTTHQGLSVSDFSDIARATLASVESKVLGFELTGEANVFDHPSGKPFHVLSPPQAVFQLHSVSGAFAWGPEQFASRLHTLLSDKEKKTGLKLLNRSLDENEDDLASFLFAFTALESLIAEQFKTYKDDPLEVLRISEAECPKYTKSFYRYYAGLDANPPIAARFAVVAYKVGLQNRSQANKDFHDAKDARNKITHPSSEGGLLPTSATQDLYRKILNACLQESGVAPPI